MWFVPVVFVIEVCFFVFFSRQPMSDSFECDISDGFKVLKLCCAMNNTNDLCTEKLVNAVIS